MKPNALSVILLFCLVVCVTGGCGPSQPRNNTSALSEQVDALTNRIEELENHRQQTSSDYDPEHIQVDSANVAGVFADATHVVAIGHNVVVYFATTNYAAGEPSEATAHLSVYMNYYTAKRLEAALAMSMQRHIDVFGDVQAVEDMGQPALHNKTESIYANFVRLTGSPEELILDLGLNPKPVGPRTEPIRVAYTVIMDFHTAGALLRQVSALIAEYEAKHGPIETDIQKRITN